MAEIKYEIIRKLGILSTNQRGWKKEVNYITWNDRPAKIDIRDWDENNVKMGKGITLTKEEAEELKVILNSIDLSEFDS